LLFLHLGQGVVFQQTAGCTGETKCGQAEYGCKQD
jgi:hypothetical protein